MLQPGETVQSQYAASPVIRALAESARIRIAPDADIELFYRSVFNIATASGAGLDIWGRILGIGRKVDITELTDFFGGGCRIPEQSFAGPVSGTQYRCV